MTDDVLEHSRRKFFYFGAAALFASVTPTQAMAQSVSNKLKIGVIGSGHIGGTIGGLWVKAGHSVLFSSRHPEELKPLTDSLGRAAILLEVSTFCVRRLSRLSEKMSDR